MVLATLVDMTNKKHVRIFSAGTWIQPRICLDLDSKVMVIDGWLVEVVHKYRCMMMYDDVCQFVIDILTYGAVVR